MAKIKLRREVKVGLFALLVLLALYWGLNFLKGQDLLNRNNTYYATYDQVNGIQKSSAIMIKGYKVGIVSDILYDPASSDKVVLEFSLKSKFRIPRNSQARIYSSSLLGSKSIEIVYGDSPDYLHSGDTLYSVMDPGFLEQAGSELEFLKQRAGALMNDISTTLHSIDTVFTQNAGHINATMSNLAQMSSSLNYVLTNEREQIRSIVANINDLTAALSGNAERIDNIVANVEDFSGALAETDIAQVVDKLTLSLDHLNGTLAVVNSGEGSLGKLVSDDALYNSLVESSLNLSALLEDLKQNPGKYISLSVFGSSNKTKNK